MHWYSSSKYGLPLRFCALFFGLFSPVPAITWAQTDYGSVRVVNTAFGKGIMAWTNFEAPAGRKLGSYAVLKFLTSAEYKASPWADYGVEWSRALTAVPDCASRDELRAWVPFCNASCYENGEEPNVELLRPANKANCALVEEGDTRETASAARVRQQVQQAIVQCSGSRRGSCCQVPRQVGQSEGGWNSCALQRAVCQMRGATLQGQAARSQPSLLPRFLRRLRARLAARCR